MLAAEDMVDMFNVETREGRYVRSMYVLVGTAVAADYLGLRCSLVQP